MDLRRPKLTAEQCRVLFHNLTYDFEQVFDEVASDEDEAGWLAALSELRRAYEQTRYGLVVEGHPDIDDVEVFRNNCEDIGGVEPEDPVLTDQLGSLSSDINDSTLLVASYRQSLPATILAKFEAYKTTQREKLNKITEDLVSEPARNREQEQAPTDPDPLSDGPSIQDITDALYMIRQNLTDIKRDLEAVVSLN